MKLLFVGAFNPTRGSGYTTILENIAVELANAGHDVTVLGDKWDRSEHSYPFQVIPTDYSWIPVQVLRLRQAMGFDHVILTMDVPKIEQILFELQRQDINWAIPISGLFPIESDPLIKNWADALGVLHRRFVISKFGQSVMKSAGLDSALLPMTANVPDDVSTKDVARNLLVKRVNYGDSRILESNIPIALTVADNQERKDLPVIMEALSILKERKMRVHWALVTNISSSYGWTLPDLLVRFGIEDIVVMFEALNTEELAAAYSVCDLFVIASQAEGACLPLYEAMARGKMCVAPDHTAITEALSNGRGTMIEPHCVTVHPWGNVNRYHIRPVDLAVDMAVVAREKLNSHDAITFIKNRPWSLAAEKIEEELRD